MALRETWVMVGLATRDFRHERGLSLFAVLSVTAVVAPLLVLFGLKYGVISSMTARLDRDPGTRMLQPIGQGMHDARWFAALAARPETGFVVPSTRFLAATASLSCRATICGERGQVLGIPSIRKNA